MLFNIISFMIPDKKHSNWIFPLIIISITAVMSGSCKKEIPAELPSLTTADVNNITQMTAVGGGTIISDGGATITSHGICWSEGQAPTITNNKTEAVPGSGSFSCILKGLTPNKTYYFKAYAQNSAGIGYGTEKSFKTLDTLSNVIDIDGNIYPTVTIGTQVWMAQNLKTTRYRDGAKIPEVTDNTAWCVLTSDAFCWYNNKRNVYGLDLGAIYNWYSVNTGLLAPTGWHVASDADWKALTTYTGGELASAGKLRTTGTYQQLTGIWMSPNLGATDEYGFSALPCGYRFTNNGFFGNLFYATGWWTSTAYDKTQAWIRTINFDSENVGRGPDDIHSGFSVRCVKN